MYAGSRRGPHVPCRSGVDHREGRRAPRAARAVRLRARRRAVARGDRAGRPLPGVAPRARRRRGGRRQVSVSLRHRLEYAVVLGLRALARTLPRRLSLAAGGALGKLFHRLHGSRRELAVANLRAAFPDRTEADCRRVLRATFAQVGRHIVDFLCFDAMSLEQMLPLVEIEGGGARPSCDGPRSRRHVLRRSLRKLGVADPGATRCASSPSSWSRGRWTTRCSNG